MINYHSSLNFRKQRPNFRMRHKLIYYQVKYTNNIKIELFSFRNVSFVVDETYQPIVDLSVWNVGLL